MDTKVKKYNNTGLKKLILQELNKDMVIVDDVDLKLQETEYRNIVAKELIIKIIFKRDITYEFHVPIFKELKAETLNVLQLIKNDYLMNELSELVADDIYVDADDLK